MLKVSALVITRNEEANLEECLSLLGWADEVVVLDSDSTDRTVEIARRYTPRVYQHEFVSHPRKRNAAIKLAAYPWVFFCDADERVPQALAEEMRAALEEREKLPPRERPAGYWLARRNIILGRWVRYAGWYPDYQLRLFLRDRARFDERRAPHEVLLLDGPSARLKGELVHYNYRSFRELVQKQRAYAVQEARARLDVGERPRRRSLLGQPLREFGRRYFRWQGYREGVLGLVLSLVMAWYRYRVYREMAARE